MQFDRIMPVMSIEMFHKKAKEMFVRSNIYVTVAISIDGFRAIE